MTATKTKPRRRLPEHIAEAMTAVLDYLWQDEAHDYLAMSREEQQDYIFSQLITVRQWLDRRNHASKQTTQRRFGPNDNS
jgi:hypothetical protein